MESKKGCFALVELGKTVTVAKTVSESDVYLFAGLSGDVAPVHVNHEYMKDSPYGQRIAHGVLIMSFMSWASTKFAETYPCRCVSYGYDRVRFVKPVFFGDTVTVQYTATEKEDDKRILRSKVEAVNQRNEVVSIATHLMKYFD